MSNDPVLVIDAGSSSIRCHLVGIDGCVTGSTSRPWTYVEDPTVSHLAREFDTHACWTSICEAIHECVTGQGRVAAVAITSQRQSIVFLDSDANVLYAGPNTDLSAIFAGVVLDYDHGDLLYRTTGHRPAFMMAAGKLAWLKDHRPESYKSVSHVLPLADWLAFMLTRDLGCEPTLGAGAGLLDFRQRTWAGSMFDQLGLPISPIQIRDALDLAGVASETTAGLPPGTPVVVAGADTQCALIGTGALDAGRAGIVAGWSATVQLLVSQPVLSEHMTTWSGCFQIPGLWTVESSAGDAGNAYRWLASTLFDRAESPFDRMDSLAASAPVGSDGVMAMLGPSAMDVSELDMSMGGIVFPVPMTLSGPTRAHLVRAALEGLAYALRANIEQAERVAGIPANRISLSGGMTRTKSFVSIMSDVMGRPIEVADGPESTAVGAAHVARTAIGQFASLTDAVDSTPSLTRTMDPDPHTAADYQDLYHAWLDTQQTLGKIPL